MVKGPVSVDVDELYLGSHAARKPYDSHSGFLYLRSEGFEGLYCKNKQPAAELIHGLVRHSFPVGKHTTCLSLA